MGEELKGGLEGKISKLRAFSGKRIRLSPRFAAIIAEHYFKKAGLSPNEENEEALSQAAECIFDKEARKCLDLIETGRCVDIYVKISERLERRIEQLADNFKRGRKLSFANAEIEILEEGFAPEPVPNADEFEYAGKTCAVSKEYVGILMSALEETFGKKPKKRLLEAQRNAGLRDMEVHRCISASHSDGKTFYHVKDPEKLKKRLIELAEELKQNEGEESVSLTPLIKETAGSIFPKPMKYSSAAYLATKYSEDERLSALIESKGNRSKRRHRITGSEKIEAARKRIAELLSAPKPEKKKREISPELQRMRQLSLRNAAREVLQERSPGEEINRFTLGEYTRRFANDDEIRGFLRPFEGGGAWLKYILIDEARYGSAKQRMRLILGAKPLSTLAREELEKRCKKGETPAKYAVARLARIAAEDKTMSKYVETTGEGLTRRYTIADSSLIPAAAERLRQIIEEISAKPRASPYLREIVRQAMIEIGNGEHPKSAKVASYANACIEDREIARLFTSGRNKGRGRKYKAIDENAALEAVKEFLQQRIDGKKHELIEEKVERARALLLEIESASDPSVNPEALYRMIELSERLQARFITVTEYFSQKHPEVYAGKSAKAARNKVTFLHKLVEEEGIVQRQEKPFHHSYYYFRKDDKDAMQKIDEIVKMRYNPKNRRFRPVFKDSYKSHFENVAAEEIPDYAGNPEKYHWLRQKISQDQGVMSCMSYSGEGKGRKLHVKDPEKIKKIVRKLIMDEMKKKRLLTEMLAEAIAERDSIPLSRAKIKAQNEKFRVMEDSRISEMVYLPGGKTGKAYWITTDEDVFNARRIIREIFEMPPKKSRVCNAKTAYEKKESPEQKARAAKVPQYVINSAKDRFTLESIAALYAEHRSAKEMQDLDRIFRSFEPEEYSRCINNIVHGRDMPTAHPSFFPHMSRYEKGVAYLLYMIKARKENERRQSLSRSERAEERKERMGDGW